MYGLIIEGVHYMVSKHFSEELWHKCCGQSLVNNTSFSSHERYSERMVPNLLTSLTEQTGMQFQEIGILAGKYFIHFMCQYDYDKLLKIVGRRFSDFLKGLDNIHEYFRFSYPKLRPPSFYCEREDAEGVVLHYRSRRPGYISYVMGQLIEMAKMFFEMDVDVTVLRREEKRGIMYCVMRVRFENPDYKAEKELRKQIKALNESVPVDSVSFLSMFPFYIVFSKNLKIELAGKALKHLMPDLIGKRVDEEFALLRPVVRFTWEACKHHTNNIFKLQSSKIIQRRDFTKISFKVNDVLEDKIDLPEGQESQVATLPPVREEVEIPERVEKREGEVGYPLFLKGQMLYVARSEVFVYLASCEVETLDQMFELGLYVNDYALSDCNRDMIMTTVQQSDSLKELLKGEREKSRILASNLKEIDLARKRAKDLLSQMMPRAVANQLLSATEPTTICHTYEAATIAFCKVKEFQALSSDLTAMALVDLLNRIYSTFDDILEKHGVYKVETIGESYMLSAGCPIATPFHAEYVMDTCLEILDVMKDFRETTKNRRVMVKFGSHSGGVVGGVVGQKAPRFCLFGDTVNCSSRMESHNEVVGTIQASIHTKEELDRESPAMYTFISRGYKEIKGKGKMEVVEVANKHGPPRYQIDPLVDTSTEADNENLEEYTPVEELESTASTISRMSVSKSFMSNSSQMSQSHRTGSRASGSDAGTPTASRLEAAEVPFPDDNDPNSMLDEAVDNLRDMKVHDPKQSKGTLGNVKSTKRRSHGQIEASHMNGSIDEKSMPPVDGPTMNGEATPSESKRGKSKGHSSGGKIYDASNGPDCSSSAGVSRKSFPGNQGETNVVETTKLFQWKSLWKLRRNNFSCSHPNISSQFTSSKVKRNMRRSKSFEGKLTLQQNVSTTLIKSCAEGSALAAVVIDKTCDQQDSEQRESTLTDANPAQELLGSGGLSKASGKKEDGKRTIITLNDQQESTEKEDIEAENSFRANNSARRLSMKLWIETLNRLQSCRTQNGKASDRNYSAASKNGSETDEPGENSGKNGKKKKKWNKLRDQLDYLKETETLAVRKNIEEKLLEAQISELYMKLPGHSNLLLTPGNFEIIFEKQCLPAAYNQEANTKNIG